MSLINKKRVSGFESNSEDGAAVLRKEHSDEMVSECVSHPKQTQVLAHTLKTVIEIWLGSPGLRVNSLSLDMNQDLIQI